MSTSYGPFLKFEGTTDLFLEGTQAIIVSFMASGSITAGNGVVFSTDGKVMVDMTATPAYTKFAGVAMKSAADGDKVGVIVLGALKNLVSANGNITYGDKLVLSNGGQFSTTGSVSYAAICGKAYSATTSSGSAFLGFIEAI